MTHTITDKSDVTLVRVSPRGTSKYSNLHNFWNNENFVERLSPVYKSLKITSQDKLLKNKDLIGFVGAPWTLLVYMINKISPKNNLNENFFKDTYLIKQLLKIINKFLKIHIEQQIKNGATIIQIFDSWAGLLEKKDVEEYIYIPTLELVNHIISPQDYYNWDLMFIISDLNEDYLLNIQDVVLMVGLILNND